MCSAARLGQAGRDTLYLDLLALLGIPLASHCLPSCCYLADFSSFEQRLFEAFADLGVEATSYGGACVALFRYSITDLGGGTGHLGGGGEFWFSFWYSTVDHGGEAGCCGGAFVFACF